MKLTSRGLEGVSPFELALLMVGTERTAIRHARRMYDLDAKQARLLVRTARNGTCSNCGQVGCLFSCRKGGEQ